MSPVGLLQLQRHLQAYLLSKSSFIQAHILGTDAKFIQERLAIYQEGYQLRLAEVLASDFPGVKALLGDGLFEQTAIEYIAAYPSRHPNVRYYGEHFASFLKQHPVLGQRPELMEMALFEWTLGLAEDAADTALLTQADLVAIPETDWPEFQFHLHPSVHFIALSTNVPLIWQAIQHGHGLPLLQNTTPRTYTIWRHDFTAYYHTHTEQELSFLQAVMAKQRFESICELLAKTMNAEQAAQLAINFVLTFMNNHMLVHEADE